MKKNQIYVHTQNKIDQRKIEKDRKITSKQWYIYYYMISQSKYNVEQVEDHRFLYKKDFNVRGSCRLLGIKSPQTFYNAIKKLQEVGLVKICDEYYLLYAKTPIEIEQNVLRSLVAYSTGTNCETHIDLLRIYLILKKLNKIANSAEERQFTKRQLVRLLGHNDETASYYKDITIYLALLSFWNLIELKRYTYHNAELGNYTIYTLVNVNEKPCDEFKIDIEAETNAVLPSQSLMDRLKISEADILNS